MPSQRVKQGLETLADTEYKLAGGVKGAPAPWQSGPDIYIPVVDELASAVEAKQSGASALEALKKGEYGEAGLESLRALLSAAGAAPLVGAPARAASKASKASKASNRINKEETTRDYPDVNLSSRLNFKKQIQFLEDHGYSLLRADSKNKDFTYKVEDDRIIAYTPLGGTKTKVEQKTFKNPTLKQMRNWMGYKKGGSIVKRNPHNYTAKAI